jgi:hypothetical protein
MYCVKCGSALQPGQNFCAGCGTRSEIAPATPVQNRLSEHLRLLAILWLAISAFRMIPGLVLVTMFGFISRFLPPDVPQFVFWILEWIGFVFIAGAAIGFVAGWGLLERRPWARMLTVALGCFSLFEVPFGTVLGIYTLWVLLPAQSEEEFRRLSDAA